MSTLDKMLDSGICFLMGTLYEMGDKTTGYDTMTFTLFSDVLTLTRDDRGVIKANLTLIDKLMNKREYTYCFQGLVDFKKHCVY